MSIFEANFCTQCLIVFSGSQDGHDIYKWVPTKRSLGTTAIDDRLKVEKTAMLQRGISHR